MHVPGATVHPGSRRAEAQRARGVPTFRIAGSIRCRSWLGRPGVRGRGTQPRPPAPDPDVIPPPILNTTLSLIWAARVVCIVYVRLVSCKVPRRSGSHSRTTVEGDRIQRDRWTEV